MQCNTNARITIIADTTQLGKLAGKDTNTKLRPQCINFALNLCGTNSLPEPTNNNLALCDD